MKNNNTCPKCHSQKIIRIPGSVGAHGAGNNILTNFTIFGAVKVTRYVCAECGFSEEWIENSEDINKLKENFESNF